MRGRAGKAKGGTELSNQARFFIIFQPSVPQGPPDLNFALRTYGARLRLAHARLAAAVCAAGPGDSTGKRSGYRFWTAARLLRIT